LLGKAAAATALVKQNGTHVRGMKQLAVARPATAARATMKKYHWNTRWVTALFEIHRMAVFFRQKSMLIGFDGGV
jgi:hypothetical protein